MKVIAIFDKPKSCASCPCCETGYAFDMCRLSKRLLSSYDSINIPKWCELRQLPRKLNENDWHRMFSGLFSEREAKGHGWNACLDAITGVDDNVIDY